MRSNPYNYHTPGEKFIPRSRRKAGEGSTAPVIPGKTVRGIGEGLLQGINLPYNNYCTNTDQKGPIMNSFLQSDESENQTKQNVSSNTETFMSNLGNLVKEMPNIHQQELRNKSDEDTH